MANNDSILYMFDRPTEPCFTKKGDDQVAFDVPSEYLIDRYKPLAEYIHNRFGSGKTTIPVSKMSKFPDLSFQNSLKREDPFSLFYRHHNQMASKLIEIFMAAKSYEELLSLSVYCRDRVNPHMYIYALSVVLLHRPDTRNLKLPSHVEMFPNLYIDGSIFGKAKEESSVVAPGQRTAIEIPSNYTSNEMDIEQVISYFREDIGINLHHWHWHLVYPFEGPTDIVDKDRRGELFYYMHQQILARYNFERLSNNLNRVVRLTDWREPILEGYFPKLDTITANRVWPPRPANSVLKNINREKDQVSFDIEDLERWRDRIFNAIHSGFVTNTEGKQIALDDTEGINILGNLIEASVLSVNPNLYGSLHNNGHNAISFIHDPDNRYLENYSVMGDTSTAMRDPVFYRWHAYLNNIFQEFKATFPGYTTQDLIFENVKIQSVEVTTDAIRNELRTFWAKSDVDLSRGLEFVPRGSIFARFTHLQHLPFNYKIVVENTGSQRTGTVRIFIAPKHTETSDELLFNEQKNLFVELDKFSVLLTRGRNVINRRSIDSSVTIPHEVTYRKLDNNRPVTGSQAENTFNFCGCGWPQNMLIPKGSSEGFPCHVFVMVTNDQMDNVVTDGKTCNNAASYCGIRNAKYPDKRPMGFPFDRIARDGVITLRQFLTDNMTVQEVKITFNKDFTPAQQTANQGKNKA